MVEDCVALEVFTEDSLTTDGSTISGSAVGEKEDTRATKEVREGEEIDAARLKTKTERYSKR
jgi:hypothetical protein